MRPDKTTLRKFGITLAMILSFIALIQLKKYNPMLSSWFGIVSASILAISIISPIIILPIYVIIHTISKIIGWINTKILLSIVFFAIFTPIGLVLRLFNKDLLDKKIDKNARSYWNAIEEEVDAKSFKRQY